MICVLLLYDIYIPKTNQNEQTNKKKEKEKKDFVNQ